MKGRRKAGRAVALVVLGGAALAVAAFSAREADAQVRYDRGRRVVNGVQLLQDYNDSLAYYYLPQVPRLARSDDGAFQLLCLKYVGADGASSGGLLHALFEFDLPSDVVDSLQAGLSREVPDARIVGLVPLLDATSGDSGGEGSFQLVSSVLRESEDGGLARSVVTSGRAPLLPGSRAVVAAMLEPEGATLLWNSLTGPTSDVSVSVHAYYEAAVEAYNARVDADIDLLYEHFDEVTNEQGLPTGTGSNGDGPDRGLFTREFISTAVDSLIRTGGIQVTVLDRSEALDVDAGEMEGILQLTTDKLVELMFDATSGWSQEPPREGTLAYEQIQGKQPEGILGKFFGNGLLNAIPGVDMNQPYYSDDLYVRKNRTDIRRNHFSIVLSKNTTVKVPVDASGNLGGVYTALDADPRYFRVVDLDDPAFQFRDIHFQVDGDFVDSFSDLVNFVSVSVRKRYDENPTVVRDFVLSRDDIEQGVTIRSVSFPRLGEAGDEWHQYEYRTEWSLRGGPTLSAPETGDWVSSVSAAVPLRPPLDKRKVEIAVDRLAFERHGLASAVVRFATVLAGEPQRARELHLRADDPDPSVLVSLFHDPGEPVAYQVDWYRTTGAPLEGELSLLESDYLFLTPATLGAGR